MNFLKPKRLFSVKLLLIFFSDIVANLTDVHEEKTTPCPFYIFSVLLLQ